MKMHGEHRVPLSAPAVEVLDAARTLADGNPLAFPREGIEASLAHVVRNRVEAAYARSDLFERRRRLMDDWAAYLAATPSSPLNDLRKTAGSGAHRGAG